MQTTFLLKHLQLYGQLCLLLAGSVISSNAQAEPARALPEFHARYGILFMGMKVAEADYELSYTTSGYKLSQKTRLVGFASWLRSDTVDAVSHIEDDDGQLLLTQYDYIQKGDDKEEHYHIVWDKSRTPVLGRVTGQVIDGDKVQPVELRSEGPVWDLLSFQIPLMRDARADRKDYPYTALLDGEIDSYHLVLRDTSEVTLQGKRYDSLHVSRKDPRPNKDREMHVWLLPALHNIPFRLENHRDGKLHSYMKLEELKFKHGKHYSAKDDDSDDDEF